MQKCTLPQDIMYNRGDIDRRGRYIGRRIEKIMIARALNSKMVKWVLQDKGGHVMLILDGVREIISLILNVLR